MADLNLENKKVLVVEDDDLSFLYLNQLFLITKGTVVRQKTGIDAIDDFRQSNNYDLILMDIQLPDMDGKQVTREIRKMNSRIPIIAQTASRSVYEKDLILESGCTDLLSKPFTIEEFFTTLEKYI